MVDDEAEEKVGNDGDAPIPTKEVGTLDGRPAGLPNLYDVSMLDCISSALH